ncbi:MAG: class I SAM-dependent RNA methyltransferase [Spirochaetales bacterium]|nr:class I SAM-dependent RNA methyltransferase [Spirochaetales bacterium]
MNSYRNLKIEKLVYGGYGLARSQGDILFIKGVLSGETVHAKRVSKKGSIIFAEPVAIPGPSAQRISPVCKYYGTCGGCDWQHIDYPTQVSEKRAILAESFKRIGKIHLLPEIEVITGPQWAYRIRVQLKADIRNRKLGFYRQTSHAVVDVEQCPLLASPLNTLLEKRKDILSLLPGQVNQVKTICGRHEQPASFPLAGNYTREYTDILVGTYTFRVSGKSFFQANRYLHYQLGTWARPQITGHSCIDLFGGTGFFSCMLGDMFTGGIMIEHDKDQVILAKKNLSANDVKHFTAKTASVEEYLKSPPPFPPDRLCIVLDPPRTGLSRELRHSITRIKPLQMVYISCNPATLARDAGEITGKGNYTISRIALFDCFPQTHHIECGIILARKG